LPDGWTDFWRGCRSDVARRHARPGASEALVAEIEAFLAGVGELDASGRALLHTELLGEHVLVEQRSGRHELSALIDFADGRVGPPDYEVAAPVEFLFRGERGLLGAFLEAAGMPSDDAGAERRLAWALCHRFGSLARMERAVEPVRPASLSELARLLYAG
jgi:hygromycin-B 7''-O-kinase